MAYNETTLAHIIFKRDRKSGSYIPDKSYPTISPPPKRHDPYSRRRHSSVVLDQSGSPLPTLDSLLSSSTSSSRVRAQSRRPSMRPSEPPLPPPELMDRTTVIESRDHTENVFLEVDSTSALGGDVDMSAVSSTPLRPSGRQSQMERQDEEMVQESLVNPVTSYEKLHTAFPPADAVLSTHHTITRLILLSIPHLPPSPNLQTLTYCVRRLLHPKPLVHLLPALVDLLSQIELHRLLYVREAKRALAVHESLPKGDAGRLLREQRRQMKSVCDEKVDAAVRRKWWALTLHLRKSHIREQLTIDPHPSSPTALLSLTFPPTGVASHTLSTSHLLPSEQSELLALHTQCEHLIHSVSAWASQFSRTAGTPEQAQAEFDQRWPMKLDWPTTVGIVVGYCEDVEGAENALREVFPDSVLTQGQQGEVPKIEPLEEMTLRSQPKIEPFSPVQHFVRSFG